MVKRKKQPVKVEKPKAQTIEERITKFVVERYDARKETVKITAHTSLGNWHVEFVDGKGINRMVVVHPDEVK